MKRENVFFGDDGLRAGWSILLFLAPFLMLAGLGLIMKHYAPVPHPAGVGSSPSMTPLVGFVGEGVPFLFIAAAAFGMSRIEGREFGRYGLALKRMLPDFAAGLGWGALMLSLLIGVLYVTHAIAFDGIALHGVRALPYGIEWAAAFVFVGLFEEFFFRGYLQFTLSRGIAGIVRAVSPRNPDSHFIGFWVSAFVLSVCIFAYSHTSNGGETVIGIIAVGCVGLVFALSLWRTGSLWWAIGFHAAWDWGESFFYGTPDSGGRVEGHLLATHPIGSATLSGGSAGPEGSILVIPTLLVVGLVIHLTLPRRDYPLTSDQSPPDERTPPHLQSTA